MANGAIPPVWVLSEDLSTRWRSDACYRRCFKAERRLDPILCNRHMNGCDSAPHPSRRSPRIDRFHTQALFCVTDAHGCNERQAAVTEVT